MCSDVRRFIGRATTLASAVLIVGCSRATQTIAHVPFDELTTPESVTRMAIAASGGKDWNALVALTDSSTVADYSQAFFRLGERWGSLQKVFAKRLSTETDPYHRALDSVVANMSAATVLPIDSDTAAGARQLSPHERLVLFLQRADSASESSSEAGSRPIKELTIGPTEAVDERTARVSFRWGECPAETALLRRSHAGWRLLGEGLISIIRTGDSTGC
jgi:hypothetical protein